MLDLIKETKRFIESKLQGPVRIGIVLGSGLGSLSDEIEVETILDYADIPNFPISTVEGHQGQMIIGKLEGISIIALKGRFHYYEGYRMQETTFPIRVFKALGIETILLSNASGGLNPAHKIGDLMILNDHIHLFPENPLRGKNIDELGSRFPDMSQPYCFELIGLARDIGQKLNLNLHEGVYVGTAGPNYETPSEYKYFRYIGADAVGMSTTAETIVAVHGSMKVFAVSIISDLGVEGQIVEISHDEVQEVASIAAPKLSALFKEMVKKIAENMPSA